MAKIAIFKLEIPAGDRAAHDAMKAAIQSAVRSLGTVAVSVDPTADPALLEDDHTAFYGTATVKRWVQQGERKPKAAKVTA